MRHFLRRGEQLVVGGLVILSIAYPLHTVARWLGLAD